MPAIVCRIVEVCVFKREQGIPKYLLLKRAKNEKIYPGIWQFVSGMIEEGEDALKAALREFYEETGLQATHFWVVPFVNSFYVAADDLVHLSPLFAAEVSADNQPTLSSEHQAFEWLSFEEAERTLVWPGQRHGLNLVHQYIVGGEQTAQLTEIEI